MKKVFLLLCITFSLSNFHSIYGQSVNDGFHQHTGFYLSLSAGPVFGTIEANEISPVPFRLNFSGGTGGQFDIKVGGAIRENLILHATIISNALIGPKVTSNGQSITLPDNMNINETMLLGGGVTYYLMPHNIFLSGSVGMGYFTMQYKENSDLNGSTDKGVSMQIKVGKEWWISKKWGLGVALTYGKTNVNNRPSSGYAEKLNSNRFGIVLNATLN